MLNRKRQVFRMVAGIGLIAHPIVLRAQHVGFTIASTTSDVHTTYGDGTASSYENRKFFGGGLTYRHHLSPRKVLQTELLYVPKGSGSSGTKTLGYIEVPVLLRLGALAPTGAKVSPVFSLGPTVAVLATCRLQGVEHVLSSDSCDQVIITPFSQDYRMRPVDVGLMLGLGLEARAKDGGIVGIEGRLEYGLVDSEHQSGFSHNITFFVMLHLVPSKLY